MIHLFCGRRVFRSFVLMKRSKSSSKAGSTVPLEEEEESSSSDTPIGIIAERRKRELVNSDVDDEEGESSLGKAALKRKRKTDLLKSEKWKTTTGERSLSRSGDVLLNPTKTVSKFDPVLPNESEYAKIVSWNCNGLRAVLAKASVESYVKQENPLVFCLQETKTNVEKKGGVPDMKPVLGEAYAHHYWNHGPKAYSGNGVFSKVEAISVLNGMGIEKHDGNGRIVALEFEKFWLVSCYTPNSGDGLKNLEYRKEWNKDFHAFVLGLSKPAIIVGDLNCAHNPVDLFNPSSNKKSAGFTVEERADFTKLLEAGFHDVFREEHPVADLNKTLKEKGDYSYWGYRFNLREQNKGWRVDYCLVHKDLRKFVVKSFNRTEMLGSDHCPVGILVEMQLFKKD